MSSKVGFELLPHSPYTPNVGLKNLLLLPDLKKTIAGKKFDNNKDIIAKTESYFEAKDREVIPQKRDRKFGKRL